MAFYIGGTKVIDNSANHISGTSNGSYAYPFGFLNSGSVDIGNSVRYTSYTDDRVANCGGYLPTGNCLGNTSYVPPNGNWWTWGVSGISTSLCGNPSGYDFGGGSSSQYYPVNQIALIYASYSLLADRVRGADYHRNVYACNCNNNGSTYYTVGNCYTNCNCNCDCNCSTDSTGGTGSSCFLKGSLVKMADGTNKLIEDVKIGDKLLGAFGEVNEVLALDRPFLGNRYIYVINGEHNTTHSHAHIRGNKTFAVLDLHAWLTVENETAQTVITEEGEEDWVLPGLEESDLYLITQLATGEELLTLDGNKIVKTITQHEYPEDTLLYNFVLSGNHTYFVDGYCVTGFLNGKDFDYRTWTSKGKPYTKEDYKRG
jgi:hypothetical protein